MSLPLFPYKGNKCYKIVYGQDNGRGLSWNDALTECRSATTGLRPDLASIVDQFQMCKCRYFNIICNLNTRINAAKSVHSLKLMTNAINRTGQCIPPSVFKRQLNSQHLCTGFCKGAFPAVGETSEQALKA